jgi:glycosyltransferase involved in cell wall biosynthesis
MYGVNSYVDDGENYELSLNVLYNSDLMHVFAASGEDILHQMKTIHQMQPADSSTGFKVPPAIIYDVDDNFDFVHPFNDTYVRLGVRSYPDGALLRPNEQIDWLNPKTNELEALWVDQETVSGSEVFDIARNLKQMKVRHQVVREADAATVPSPALASYFRDVLKQPNVYVYPNSVKLSDYKQYELVRHDPDKVRILWQGSSSHIVDWYPLREAIKEVAHKYPNTTWVIYGQWFDFIHMIIPEEQVEYHPWTDYAAYKTVRGLLTPDINLCPLVDDAFNRCKSPIKWYESTVWKYHTEATLASKVSTYNEIKDGETGLLYSSPQEFVEKLSALIEDAQLRIKLGTNAKQWVMDNRTIEKTTPGLFDFYNEVRERYIFERTRGPLVKKGSNKEIDALLRQQERLLRG